MDGRKSSPSQPDRRQWRRIYLGLVEILHSQQSQMETLVGDRECLERYIHLQHEQWASLVRLLESRLAQIKEQDLKDRQLQAAKLALLVGMKQRECLSYKKEAELAESDLDDFYTCLQALNAENSALKEKLCSTDAHKNHSDMEPTKGTMVEGDNAHSLRAEIRKLKHAYKTLSSKKDAEVLALLAEKDFVWNQFKKMESDYTNLLKSKRLEAEQANESAEKLRNSLLELRPSTCKKDELNEQLSADIRKKTQELEQSNKTIEQRRCEMDELQSTIKQKDEVIVKLRTDADAQKSVRLSNDLNSQSNRRNTSRTLANSRLTRNSLRSWNRRDHAIGKTNDDTTRKRKVMTDESSGLQASAAVTSLRRSTRHLHRRPDLMDSPKLFSSTFKVPKLKNCTSSNLRRCIEVCEDV